MRRSHTVGNIWNLRVFTWASVNTLENQWFLCIFKLILTKWSPNYPILVGIFLSNCQIRLNFGTIWIELSPFWLLLFYFMDLFPVVSFPWKLVLDKLEMGNKWEELGIFLLQQNLTKTQFTTIPVTPFLFWIPTLYNWINCFSKYKLFPISKIQDTKGFGSWLL